MKKNPVVHEAFTDLAPRYETVVDQELKTFWGWSYQGFVDQLIERTAIQANHKVLDIATGTAAIPRKILEQQIPDIHITGLDITEAMLINGIKNLPAANFPNSLSLVCADAMILPFAKDSYDVIVSGLASHHMDIPLMLSEMRRVLKPGGMLSVIDVGTSPFWEFPLTRAFARVIAFVYFMVKENFTRSWAEATSITNLRTPEGWRAELDSIGLYDATIIELSARFEFIPKPLYIFVNK